ncbi:gamma-glutamate kinase [uncultured Desulfatiglans sp.]|nr:gamma-glutamate kinase [uncultured Desulfatiglans sp.]
MKSELQTGPVKTPGREALLKGIRRIVVKVGSGVLTASDGLNRTVIESITDDIADLRRSKIEIILVSSGAIASGLRKVGLKRRPESVSQQQALAAVGQSSLMRAYEEAFGRHRQKVAQILVTRDDLTHRRRYLNARNTLLTLLSWKIVPIINENDTVVVDEIKFGDNDNLSAMITCLSEAGLLVNLTNLDGLFDKDPRVHQDARLIHTIDKVDRRVSGYASTIPGFLGKGGMASKVKAAQKVALLGVPTVIANGFKPGVLKRVLKGEEEGTLFMPRSVSLCHRKHWIAFTKSPRGQIVVDKGAETALLENGKSLLPSGIKEVVGRFSLGDAVLIVSEEGEDLAVGMVNYHSGDLKKIMGAKTSGIEAILGFKHEDEVVHRDNLVLARQLDEGDDLCQWRG